LNPGNLRPRYPGGGEGGTRNVIGKRSKKKDEKSVTDPSNRDAHPPEKPAEPSGEKLRPEDFYYEGPYLVFTAAYHLKRGYCCNSGCRHCPYK
jgi:hypothetical protein